MNPTQLPSVLRGGLPHRLRGAQNLSLAVCTSKCCLTAKVGGDSAVCCRLRRCHEVSSLTPLQYLLQQPFTSRAPPLIADGRLGVHIKASVRLHCEYVRMTIWMSTWSRPLLRQQVRSRGPDNPGAAAGSSGIPKHVNCRTRLQVHASVRHQIYSQRSLIVYHSLDL